MRFGSKSFSTILALVLVLFGANGCSPDDPPSPTQPTIQPLPTGQKAVSLSANPEQINADGRSASFIVANCTVGGQEAPSNLPVRFQTDKGDFSIDGADPINPVETTRIYDAMTADGQSNIYLIGEEQEGVATVTATFGYAASDTATVEFIRSGSDAASISLSLTPDSGDSPLAVQAEATVKSHTEEPLEGAQVVFNITDNAAKIDRKRVETGNDGVASTFIRNIQDDATITATFGDIKAKALVNIENEKEVGEVELEITPESGTAPLSVVAKATVKSTSGDELYNETVEFSINDNSAKIENRRVRTDASGEAGTVIRNIGDDAMITAKAGKFKAQKLVDVENEKDIGALTLTVSPESGVAPLDVTAELEVKSTSGKALPNILVEFSINDANANIVRDQVKTDTNGKAGTQIRGITKDATITAKAGNFRVKKLVDVEDASDIASVTLALAPSTGSAPLTTKATATVKSKSNKAIPGVDVTFSISDSGAQIERRKVVTDANGVASTFISNITEDATVTAQAGGMSADALVEIDNDTDRSITLVAIRDGATLSEPVLMNNSAQLMLRATVRSAQSGGSPVPNVTVTFSCDDSSAWFTKNSVKTNTNGEAETYVNNIDQNATVTASTSNTSDTLVVKINKPPVASFALVSGTPTAGQVNNLVYSAANSNDPDESYGDKITFKWTVTINASADVSVSTSSTTDEVITVTVGTAGGTTPSAGDELTIVLTVTDTNGLTDTQVTTITF